MRLEDIKLTREKSLNNMKQEREILLKKKDSVTDEEELKKINTRLKFIERALTPIDKDCMLLPEYRKDGYFNSEEFKKIEADVDNMISQTEGIDRRDIEEVKRILLKEKYNIDWRPSYDRFIPGTIVIRD